MSSALQTAQSHPQPSSRQSLASLASLAALAIELRGTPYAPVRFLAQGGMGTLLEVEHRNLRRRFAMKVLRDTDRPDLEDRLRVEAHALAQLSHPNVLAVVDFDRTSAGRPYIVAELLEGSTLRDLLEERGRLEVPEAVDLVRQALAGLAAAHRLGIVHRDIKLENLFVVESDEEPPKLKVIDFGIAKIIDRGNGRGTAIDPPLVPTDEGIMVGTPSFMSPEQIMSRPVDHRADIYGMGVVLYRLLTGYHPFQCDNALDYARAHATFDPPAPSSLTELPPGLDAVVLRALEKKPADRFDCARDMITALTPFVTNVAPPIFDEDAPTNLIPIGLIPLELLPLDPAPIDDEPEAHHPTPRPSAPGFIAAPITTDPEFAPVAPPSKRSSFHEPLPRLALDDDDDDSNFGLHGTIIVPRTTLESTYHDDTETRLVSPFLSPENPPKPAPTSVRLRRIARAIRARDIATWIATLIVVFILCATSVYVGQLVSASR